jgi:hypothetical protein
MTPRLTMIAALATGLLLASCGSSDSDDAGGPDVEALKAGFEEGADAAYAAEDLDREQDFGPPVLVDECFVLDQEGAERIAAALPVAGESVRVHGEVLSGTPGEDETLNCTVREDAADGDTLFGVSAGTTAATREQLLARLLQIEGSEEVEGEAPGLDPSEVVGTRLENSRVAGWVADDFTIAISGPTEQLGEDAFEALPIAVDEVSRTLAGD